MNAGISGDTTLDVLGRLDRAVSDRTYLVFLEIGPNDGFRRYDPAIISDGYRERFDAIYGHVAERFDLAIMPGFLRSLVAQGRYWQADGLHPTAEGDRILARDVLAFLNPAWKLTIEPRAPPARELGPRRPMPS